MVTYIFIGFLGIISLLKAFIHQGVDGSVFSALFWISICFLILVKKIDGLKSQDE